REAFWPPVSRMRRVGVHAVVAPVALARERRDRHHLDRGDTELAQLRQPLGYTVECARRRERTDMQLVHDELVERDPERRAAWRLDDPGGSANAHRLKAGTGIRQRLPVQNEDVVVSGSRADDARVPAVVLGLEAMLASPNPHGDITGRRCPGAKLDPVLECEGAEERPRLHPRSMTDDAFRCTYRLQLLPHLDFRRAEALVPYLRDLGVSRLYLSTSMQARSGSTHGYDVVDPTHLSDDLGGEEAFRSLCRAGLGVVLDIVPNHMAASDEENPFWRAPLRRAKFFDVEWRTGGVRRFFDIGDLAGVRMEDPEVFEATHSKVAELVRAGLVDGVRVDHPDGLANPARYLHRLRETGVERVWVEKILEAGEQLRDWPVCGTTGYEFANDVTGLFVDAAAEESLTELYSSFTGEERSFAEIALEAKLEQARTTFEPEVDRLLAQLGQNDLELDLPRALASFHVYRT